MLRFLYCFFLIFTCNFIAAQTSPESLIDSLNVVKEPSKKVALCNKIASTLQSTDWDRALHYLELGENEALKISKKGEDLASVYETAGRIYSAKDAYDIGLDYYLEAYDIYKELGAKDKLTDVEINLAILYAQGKNHKEAFQYFNKAYVYQKEQKDSLALVRILNNMGTLFLKKDKDSAIYYYKKAIAINNKIQNKKLQGYITTNLGRAYSLKQDTMSANRFFNVSKNMLGTENLDQDLTIFINQSLAKYNLSNKHYQKAITWAQQGLELSKHYPNSFVNQDLNKVLYESYIQLEDYKHAVHYFQQYKTISDTINIEEKAVNLERVKLEEEYNNRIKIKDLVEEKKRLTLYSYGLILIVGILILVISLIKIRNKNIKIALEQERLQRRQQELQQSLETKNKVLIGKAMTEIHRTDVINDILNDLKQIKLKAVKKETQQAIDFILKRLQKDMNSDIWQEFEVSFEQVHQSFYDDLSKYHPDLTPKDRRLCALLYLDLTTKEISQITGQSFKSVENARTRLRKKLDLTNGKVNLSTYLNSFASN
ncbi:tetratricopeptide repeat protein [Formosa haliotis]|uniref:tetratricopeptide repeat protein n=1 Tax=Formosa haliotis TaxID=1555194 RepID=UPI00082675CD|nr:tetratricopeptide repeat protein [Formosa haliotis]